MTTNHTMRWQKTFNQFDRWLRFRLDQYFSGNPADDSVPAPVWPGQEWPYPLPDTAETIVLLTALVPHVQPDLFETIIRTYLPKGGDFPEFGGVKGSNTRYMLPTGDTVMFLLAGRDVALRQQMMRLLQNTHWLFAEGLLTLETVREGEPRLSGRLMMQADFLDQLLHRQLSDPIFGPDFPAQRITTSQSPDDLVLPAATLHQLEDLETWLRYQHEVMKDAVLARKIKPGFRALFHGPSGTGKTLAATLMAKSLEKPLYRIDLSQVVSKYIGETEKNLEKVFTKAQHRNWILFFDEADALFGKRSQVQNAHDKYANQEVSYLLQRVEDFPGLVILASNFKSNIDQAFLRRFNAIIEFPMPGPEERLLLWQKACPEKYVLDENVDLPLLAERFALTGSAIVQAMHYACLQMHKRQLPTVGESLLLEGIQREIRKEGKLQTG